LCGFGVLLVALAASCSHPAAPPVAPGQPLPAEEDLVVGTMDDECNGLTKALATYGECENLDPEEKTWAHEVVLVAEQSFEAGKKAAPDALGQRAIAVSCRKATDSIKAATERCHAGRRPPPDY
jgi:hypothetical protein